MIFILSVLYAFLSILLHSNTESVFELIFLRARLSPSSIRQSTIIPCYDLLIYLLILLVSLIAA